MMESSSAFGVERIDCDVHEFCLLLLRSYRKNHCPSTDWRSGAKAHRPSAALVSFVPLFVSLSLPSPHVASISRSLSCDSPSLVIVVWATGFDVLPFIMDQFCLEGTKRIECRMQKCSLVAVRYSLVVVLVQQLVPMNVLPQHCRRRRRTKQAFASSIHVFGDL